MSEDRIARMRNLELTYDEFVALVLDMLPAAEIHTDNDGQILIYTGLRGSHGLEVADATS